MGKWDMHSGVKANEKHDGGNEKILGSSSDPLLTPYRPLMGLKFYFWMWASGVQADHFAPRDQYYSRYRGTAIIYICRDFFPLSETIF